MYALFSCPDTDKHTKKHILNLQKRAKTSLKLHLLVCQPDKKRQLQEFDKL